MATPFTPTNRFSEQTAEEKARLAKSGDLSARGDAAAILGDADEDPEVRRRLLRNSAIGDLIKVFGVSTGATIAVELFGYKAALDSGLVEEETLRQLHQEKSGFDSRAALEQRNNAFAPPTSTPTVVNTRNNDRGGPGL